jgi:hypothetical protein
MFANFQNENALQNETGCKKNSPKSIKKGMPIFILDVLLFSRNP